MNWLGGILLIFGITAFGASHSAQSVYCVDARPKTFNPQINSEPSAQPHARVIYNTLLRNSAAAGNLEPSLAQSWSLSEDGKTYTFTLRTDVKFQRTSFFMPSRNFNADDVLFSFNRQRIAKHPFHPVGGGVYPDYQSLKLGEIIQDIQKLSENTVRFILHQPHARFPKYLAMDFASILSEEYALSLLKRGISSEIDLVPLGTGPFSFEGITGSSVHYHANPDYFEGPPSLKHVLFLMTADPKEKAQKIREGKCQEFSAPPSLLRTS